MFSIVIPLYNKELSITNTLNSVLNQTFTEFEVVVVNDGSTDGSVTKIGAFRDPRIRLIHQENAGVSAARNRGISEAKSEWIAFLDADDLWMKDHLSTLAGMIKDYQSYHVFCCSFKRSNAAKTTENPNEIDISITNDYFQEGLKSFFFWTSVVCIHKSVLKKVGGFNCKLSRGEDLELWMKIGKSYAIVRSNKITAVYNIESENKLTRGKVQLSKCLENYLNFENKAGFELEYLKMLAKNKIISLLKQRKIKDVVQLILKYNIRLFK